MSFNSNNRIPTLFLCIAGATACLAQPEVDRFTDRERALLHRITKLEERLAALENRTAKPVATSPASQPVASQPVESASSGSRPPVKKESNLPDWLKDTTINAYFDGYYMWNTHRPLGRVNLLRAYDVTATNFSINQTGLIIERTPAPDAGRQWGYRLDLMYGQATETLQGGAQNEPRPQVYRPVFQAYGTYVVPVGKGLTVDFGKWASALGFENNYTKDQINYSRSYFFNFLPFYHMGFRTSYNLSDNVSLGYWLVNGANQTEDFNGFKSQLAEVILKTRKNFSWTLNYYAGKEQRDVAPVLNPGIPPILSQPGLSITPIFPIPRGRLHVMDTYAALSVTDKLTLAGEFDHVINRVKTNSPAQGITGGAAYLKYQFAPRFYFGQRYVRFNDRAGLFSGTKQSLNDITSTFAFRPADGFETRLEYRRDFSSAPFFLTSDPGRLKKDQNTITLGLLWSFGGKQGIW